MKRLINSYSVYVYTVLMMQNIILGTYLLNFSINSILKANQLHILTLTPGKPLAPVPVIL